MNQIEFNKINSNHDKFKNESIHWLKDNGFIVESFGYEDVLDRDAANILRQDESTISMEIRHKPDTKVSKNGFECLIDWKSQYYKRQPSLGNTIPNLSIDAIPFFYDYKLSEKGDSVLIAYQDIFYGVEKGFFLNNKWCPYQIWYPMQNGQFRKPRQCEFVKEQFNEIGHRIGRKIIQLEIETSNGSGEPYILIPGTTIQSQKHWKDLLP